MQNSNYTLLQPVVTAKEMAEIDRKTIEEVGIPGMVLMENAGRKIVESIKIYLKEVRKKRIVIVCGKGNNGGDGYVIARYLSNLGAEVKVFHLGDKKEIKGDALANLEILERLNFEIKSVSDASFIKTVESADLLVDAILGTGVTGSLKEYISDLVNIMNQSEVPVVAVDLPTGIETDTGAVLGACVKANFTVTMGHLKRGLLFSPGRENAGNVHVAEIGFPKQVTEAMNIKCFRVTNKYIDQIIPRRKSDTFKNRCGQVLLIAGSAGLTGAAALSATATLRSGAGMAILGIPKSLNPVLEKKLTEVMTLPLPETETQALHYDARVDIEKRFEWANVLAVGPGLSTSPDVKKLVKWILESYDRTIVLDADGLNCLQNNTDVIKNTKANLILTPHPGELAGLLKMSTKDIVANPIEVARRAAVGLNSVIVLKGAPTVTASPEGIVFINSTGNAGMATAGMGDVLTGIIAGLCAQGLSPLNSAVAGVYLHGKAGDLAVADLGQAGLLAGDVLDYLPKGMKLFERNHENEVAYI